ncbi:MAG TPA: tetratricopeptide repeat protein, partial [Gemmatimonadales bacterium]|nr:tetratricopeptide repeat protein [Gemmatimonadales bacterium]
EAYSLYLRARRFSLRGVPLGARDAELLMDSAAYYARAAIAIDSSFAQAYGLLGTYYFVEAFRGWGPFEQNVDSSRITANRALATDSSLGDPYINLISKAIYLDDDWAAAIAASDKATRWSSHDGQVLQFAGIVTAEVEGRVDSALALLRKSVELEENVPAFNTLGDLYMRAGRYDSAVTVLRRALQLDPSVPGPRRRLIQSLEHLKQYPEAIAVRRAGGDAAAAAAYERGWSSGGEAGYQRVQQDDLRRQLAVLEAPLNRPYKVPDDTVPQLREEKIAALYAQLGEWSKAMDWVLKEYEHRPRRFRLYVTNPQYRGLRNDPRFLPMVRREGLEKLLPR